MDLAGVGLTTITGTTAHTEPIEVEVKQFIMDGY